MPHKTQSFALLLAGGSGTRLWPVSRDLYPKQLVRLINNRSLIQHTAIRLSKAFSTQKMRIVCGKKHVQDICQEIKEIDLFHDHLIIDEPCGRNTAPAILLGALQIYESNPNAVIFVFPADHVIDRMQQFYEKIDMADQLASDGHIVTFGIAPEYPETGYGYIEADTEKIGHGFRIKRFVEKPDTPTAEKYLNAGNFYWNAGMFAFKANVLIEAFRTLVPTMLKDLQDMISNDQLHIDRYQNLENISFDYAVMEKTDSGVVLPADFQWSDIGSWKALYDYLPKDSQHNVVIGKQDNFIMQNSQNCLAMGDERLIVVNQLKNIALIDTPDALFLSDLDHSRDAKDTVSFLKKQNRKEYQGHLIQRTEWGHVTVLDEQSDCVISKYTIFSESTIPEYQNMLQLNQWHVIRGYGEIFIDQEPVPIHAGEHITIESGMRVSFENMSKDDLVFIEISTLLQSVSGEELIFE